jgi:nitronate monooxygenase
MAGIATPELAAAVSAAGGLGSLGSAVLAPEQILEWSAAVRARTDRPFALNFFCHEPPALRDAEAGRSRADLARLHAELDLGEPAAPAAPPIAFDDSRLRAALEVRPAVVSFHFGLPDVAAVGALRDAGCRVISSATTVTEAVWLVEHGADAVIAQGAEAGGHRGSFLVPGDDGPVGTFALVPQVVDAVGVPVIAAGGIADGRGLAAALALGAAGVQVGTAFLACPEAGIDPGYRAALLAARAEDTTVTRAISGRPARALRNRATDDIPGDPLPFPAQMSMSMPLAKASPDFAALWAGQAAPLAAEIPASELVARIARGAEAVLT